MLFWGIGWIRNHTGWWQSRVIIPEMWQLAQNTSSSWSARWRNILSKNESFVIFFHTHIVLNLYDFHGKDECQDRMSAAVTIRCHCMEKRCNGCQAVIYFIFFTFIAIFPNPINRSFLLCSTEEEKTLYNSVFTIYVYFSVFRNETGGQKTPDLHYCGI